MITITFRALSFLQPKLAAKGIDYIDAPVELEERTTVEGLIAGLGLAEHEVEAVFVNHRVVPPGTALHDGDRVVLVPPGTPGPHRFLLGIAKLPDQQR